MASDNQADYGTQLNSCVRSNAELPPFVWPFFWLWKISVFVFIVAPNERQQILFYKECIDMHQSFVRDAGVAQFEQIRGL